MHYVLEIIMPQTDNVEEAVAKVMEPYSENREDEDEDRSVMPFWDFWVIGGRWAGHKLTAALDQDKLKEFYEELTERKVTVSGLVCGKEEIAPASQIPMVDEVWASYFPEYKGRACPLFKHANDQYANDCLYGDVLRIKDVDPTVTCSRLIVANIGYDGELAAQFMLETSVWNGCNYQDTNWDGTLISALDTYNKKMQNYNEDYIKKNTIEDDWIMVTVDYHS
jgi:hypothetical protein